MRVKEINTGIEIDIGAPTPTVLSNELNVYLIFYINKTDPNWDGKTINVRESTDEGITTIRFSKYAQFKFGNPNDETISGHELSKYGLQPYTIQEVEESKWITELQNINSVHPYHNDSLFEKYKHFIFFFHDSCFEIVCEEFETMVNNKPTLKEEIQRISKLLF